MKKISLLLIVLMLSACSKKMEGTYTLNGMAAPRITFTSDGKGMVVDLMGQAHIFEYEVKENTIAVHDPKHPDAVEQPMTILPDGSLQVPDGSGNGSVVFTKQKD